MRLPRSALTLGLGLALQLAQAKGEDPLQVRLQTADAHRFARLFVAGELGADALQRGYLNGAGRGVAVFTPHRIVNAQRLAGEVAKRHADYAHAIATCLPLADSLNAELRAIYLAYRGLLPELPLPAVHLVFGAGNSGGTAAPDVQVIGLEVMCKAGTSPEAFRQAMRRIFAHETVHSWQREPRQAPADELLYAALAEGVPDLLAQIVTGLEPGPERETWSRPRERELWQRFEEDRLRMRQLSEADPLRRQALLRWFANAGQVHAGVPAGWPDELGYWIGRNIAAAYLARAIDPRAALRELIALRDPEAILRASGYAPR